VTPDRASLAAIYPRVDGSTSALPLQRTIACTVFDVVCRWWEAEDLLFTPERTVLPDLEELESSPWAEIIMQIGHSGTHGSYVNLIEGEADFILVARAPSEDELALAQERGVELDVRAVALDAFVFLAHVENPVDDLSMEAIHGIYTGEITHWDQVGGGAGEIHTYKRNPNSGSQVLMETLVMRGTPMIDSPYMMVESMIGPLNMIGGNPGPEKEESGDPVGIGYSVYYYVSAIFPHERVKLIGVDGVRPTAEHIASRTYPLTTEVYAVVRADALPGSGAVLLRDWLFSQEGQAAVAESGYVAAR
jgi:phosphate transport system substrate-binding protein